MPLQNIRHQPANNNIPTHDAHDVLRLANQSLYGEVEKVSSTHNAAPPAPARACADDCEECVMHEDVLVRMKEQIKNLEEELAEAKRETQRGTER